MPKYRNLRDLDFDLLNKPVGQLTSAEIDLLFDYLESPTPVSTPGSVLDPDFDGDDYETSR